jgi:predicted kinase
MQSRTKTMATEPSVIREEGSAKTIRLTRPSVVVLCGPAACGKSTFAARHFRPTQIVSSDQARALVSDDERDQRFQTQAFTLLHCLIEQRLSINRLCVVDSTALTLSARQSLLELARRYRVPTVVLLLNVPLETCLDHDAKRERTVGRQVIERQYQLFEQAKAAIKQEGFDQVVELRAEDLESVQIEIVFRPVPRTVANAAPPERQRFAPRPSQPAAENKGMARDAQPPSPPKTEPAS